MRKYGIIGNQILDDLVTLQIQLDTAKKNKDWRLVDNLQEQILEKESELREYKEDFLEFTNDDGLNY